MDNKLNYKLVNLLLCLLIVLVIYNIRTLIFSVVSFVFDTISPILFGVMIGYVLNIYLKKINNFFNKYISVLIFVLSIGLFLYLIIFKMSNDIIYQVKTITNILIYVVKELSIKYNFNFNSIIDYLSNFNVFNIVGNIFNYITIFMITISISIYVFFNFDRIKKILDNNNYLNFINNEIEKYTCSFFILVIINILEYSLIFFLIGHPNYLFLGLLSGVLSLIPVLGGMITNIIALITAFVINYGLFIRTIIGILILSILDGYIISPLIYSKYNKISPIITILTIYIGNKLFGIMGSILALPILIIVISIKKYHKI